MFKHQSRALALVLLISAPAFADTNTKKDLATNIDVAQLVSENKHIEFIHMSELMANSTAGKEVMKELEEQKNMFAKEIQEKQQKIAQAEKTLSEKASMMNQAAQSSEMRKIEAQKEDLQMLARRKEAEFKDNYMMKTEELFKDAAESVTQVARAEGVDAVVDAETGRILYLAPSMNSTGKYLVQLEKNYTEKVAKNKATVTTAAKPAAKKTA